MNERDTLHAAGLTKGYMVTAMYTVGRATAKIGYESETVWAPSNPNLVITSYFGIVPPKPSVNAAGQQYLSLYWVGGDYKFTPKFDLAAGFYNIDTYNSPEVGKAYSATAYSLLADYSSSRSFDSYVGVMAMQYSGAGLTKHAPVKRRLEQRDVRYRLALQVLKHTAWAPTVSLLRRTSLPCCGQARGLFTFRRTTATNGWPDSKTKGPLRRQGPNSRVAMACHTRRTEARVRFLELSSALRPRRTRHSRQREMDDTHNEYVGARASPARAARRHPLRAEELLESALKRGKRRDFADRSFIRHFEHLLKACNEEADLSAFGVRALRIDILRCLRTVLQFDEIEAASPSILERPIRAPVFITGMPRSGTTFLHRLILQDPGNIAPRLFQLVYPYGTQGSRIGAALLRRWVSLQLTLFRLIAPELNALHPVTLDSPEECTDITAHAFQSLRFDAMYRVPSYNSWLERSGFLDAYRFHRRFLQHLDAQLPARRWILKSPDHLFALDDIRNIYPDARLVLVHRDPVRVLASVAKLTEVLRRPFTRSIDRIAIGREVSASWLDGARRMSELSQHPGAALHLNYRQIVSQPLEAVRAVYRYCDLVLTEEAEGRMRSWLRTGPNVKRPWREYKLAEFGLDAQLLRERFTPYTDTFGIEIEHGQRSAGTGALA